MASNVKGTPPLESELRERLTSFEADRGLERVSKKTNELAGAFSDHRASRKWRVGHVLGWIERLVDANSVRPAAHCASSLGRRRARREPVGGNDFVLPSVRIT
jgi:hypothetical protein